MYMCIDINLDLVMMGWALLSVCAVAGGGGGRGGAEG